MNFSAFGGPFSGIHQFAAKFSHEPQSQNTFTSTSMVNGSTNILDNGQRYQANSNNFNQNPTQGNHRKNNIYYILGN